MRYNALGIDSCRQNDDVYIVWAICTSSVQCMLKVATAYCGTYYSDRGTRSAMVSEQQ